MVDKNLELLELYYNHKRLLLDLLAVIHRDGGHYVAEHGIDQATEDATEIVVNLMHEKENRDAKV